MLYRNFDGCRSKLVPDKPALLECYSKKNTSVSDKRGPEQRPKGKAEQSGAERGVVPASYDELSSAAGNGDVCLGAEAGENQTVFRVSNL